LLDHLEEGLQLVQVEAAQLKVLLIKRIETTNLPYLRGRFKFTGPAS